MTGPVPPAALAAARAAVPFVNGDACRRILEAAAPAIRNASCCDLHGRNCEPLSELCCEGCTEADHPGHRKRGPCSNPILSPNTLTEAARIEAAVAAERERCARLAAERDAHYGCPARVSALLRDGGVRPFAALIREQP